MSRAGRWRWPVLALAAWGCAPDVSASLGFRPRQAGFAFSSADVARSPVVVDATLLQRLAGPAACRDAPPAPCEPTDAARDWAAQAGAALSAGRSEGMALLALRFFAGLDDPGRFGAVTAGALARSPALEQELAYWHLTQVLEGPHQAEVHAPLADALARLAAGLDPWATERFLLGLYPDGKDLGHAVLPVGAVLNGPRATVYLYDPDEPGEVRELQVRDDAWSYAAPDGLGGALESWTGSGADSLVLLPLEARDEAQGCPWCAGAALPQRGR